MGDSSKLVSTFLDLVKIDSPSGAEKEISDYILKHLTDKGFQATQDENNNIFLKIEGNGEPLFLAAHLDTVEPGRGVSPIVEGDIVKSDGKTILGADNKSTLAVILELVQKIKEEGIEARPLEILFTTDEERGLTGAAKFDYSKILAKKGLIADIAVPLGSVVLASPAYVMFDVTLTGESGHAAYPDKAKNVLDALAEILQIKKGFLDDETTLNIGIVNAGTARNAIPGEAKITGEIRSYNQEKLDIHIKNTVSRIQEISESYGLTVDIKHLQDSPAYSFSESDAFVQEVAQILKNEGLTPVFLPSPSCSDANIYNTKDFQVVNIGDGTVKTHTTEEHIKISDMEKLLNIFMKFVTIKV